MVATAALVGTLTFFGATVDTVRSSVDCSVQGVDSDEDHLSDSCEITLLKRFAPVFVVSPRACNWNAAAGRLRGGYLVAAEPVADGIRLAYMPAYLEDCGWSGPKCVLRFRGGCNPHRGDSEAVFIDIAGDPSTAQWLPRRVFLSAHCFGRSDGRCRWYEKGEVEWSGSSPVIWVAEGKNANYPSKEDCDSGHWGFDTCDRNNRAYRFPVRSQAQNVGSYRHPFPDEGTPPGCIAAPDLVGSPDLPGRECIWREQTFRGWAGREVEGSTGYQRYLKEVAGLIPNGPS